MWRAAAPAILFSLAGLASGARAQTASTATLDALETRISEYTDAGRPDDILEAIRSASLKDRLGMTMWLGARPDLQNKAVVLLFEMLRDADPKVRAQAATSLGRLGEVAYPAIFAALNRDAMLITRESGFGHNNDQSLLVSDYLAWALVTSSADPTGELLQWVKAPGQELEEARRDRLSTDPERSSNYDMILDRPLFTAFVLSRRKTATIDFAIELMRDERRPLRRTGAHLAMMMPDEMPAAAAQLAEYAISSPGGDPYEVVTKLGEMREFPQAMLVDIFWRHPSASVRRRVTMGFYAPDGERRELKPSPAYAAAAADRLGRATDPDEIITLLSVLAQHRNLPGRYVPVILKHVGAGDPIMTMQALLAVNESAPEVAKALPVFVPLLDRLDAEAREKESAEDAGRMSRIRLALLQRLVARSGSHSRQEMQGLRALIDRALAQQDFASAALAQTIMLPADAAKPSNLQALARIWSATPDPEKLDIALQLSRSKAGANLVRSYLRETFLRLSRLPKSSEGAQEAYAELAEVIGALAEIGGVEWEAVASTAKSDDAWWFCGAVKGARGRQAYRGEEGGGQSPDAARRLSRLRCPKSEASGAIEGGEEDSQSPSPLPASFEVTLAILRAPKSDSSEPKREAVACGLALKAVGQNPAAAESVALLTWPELARVADRCERLVVQPEIARPILARTARERDAFEHWALASQGEASALIVAVSTAAAAATESPVELEPLLQLARSRQTAIRKVAMTGLGAADVDALVVLETLRGGLNDPVPEVSRAAAEAIVNRGDDALWDQAAEVLLYEGVADEVTSFLDKSVDIIRPPAFINAGAEVSSLPPFPWPPPRNRKLLKFGREVPRSLLGREEDTLGTVEARIVGALGRLDPNYESGLFSVPGGFALLTRLQQIDADGRPLRGNQQWRDVRPPPSSLSDYLVRLFLAPPGFYRSVVFVFTDNQEIGEGNGSLPDYESGGRTLPKWLAGQRLGAKQAFALIYSFAKRDAGLPHFYPDLSAQVHLQQSGILTSLNRR